MDKQLIEIKIFEFVTLSRILKNKLSSTTRERFCIQSNAVQQYILYTFRNFKSFSNSGAMERNGVACYGQYYVRTENYYKTRCRN